MVEIILVCLAIGSIIFLAYPFISFCVDESIKAIKKDLKRQ